ncbi:hypothetical protein NL676_006694 [Syzygium grande]|nr:hypothetical protein NL676_006694 [Syzygium grande]
MPYRHSLLFSLLRERSNPCKDEGRVTRRCSSARARMEPPALLVRLPPPQPPPRPPPPSASTRASPVSQAHQVPNSAPASPVLKSYNGLVAVRAFGPSQAALDHSEEGDVRARRHS